MSCSEVGTPRAGAGAWVFAVVLIQAGCTGYLDLDEQDPDTDASADGGGADGGENGDGGGSGSGDGGDDPDAGGGGSDGGGTGGGSDGGGGSGGDTGASGLVPAFIAQGQMGRLTLSCDDGRSWQHNQSEDDAARCGTDPVDCDHQPSAARGVAYGNGVFTAAFGWGEPGQLVYSTNGVDWSPGVPEHSFAGVAFGNGVFVANDFQPLVSEDGVSWQPGDGELGTDVGPRRIGFAEYDGGRFVSVAYDFGDGSGDAAYSSDEGNTWQTAESFPADCGEGVRAVEGWGDIILSLNFSGGVCRSTDGGRNWTATLLLNEEVHSPILHDGDEFMFWSQEGALFSSEDGLDWTETPTEPPLRFEAVARSPEGTYVAATNQYDEQQFYRSEDGVSWESLDDSAFEASHPIVYMKHGFVEPSAAGCPAP